MEAELQALLTQHKQYFTAQPDGKIHCSLNNHCFAARADIISAFVKGPKYQKLVTLNSAELSLSKYEPFIIRSKNFPNKLFCTLTIQLLDQSLESIKTHMRGQKFRRARDKYLEDKAELKDEPDMPGPGDRPIRSDVQEGAGVGGGEGGSDDEAGGEAEEGDSDDGRESSPMMMEDEEDSEGEEGAELSDDDEVVFDDVFGDGDDDDGEEEDTPAVAAAPASSKPEKNGKPHQKKDKKSSSKGADKAADVAASSKAAAAAAGSSSAAAAAASDAVPGSGNKKQKQDSKPSKSSGAKDSRKRSLEAAAGEAGEGVDASEQMQQWKQSKKAKKAEKARLAEEDGAAAVEGGKDGKVPKQKAASVEEAVVPFDPSAKPPKKQKPPRPVSTKKSVKKAAKQ